MAKKTGREHFAEAVTRRTVPRSSLEPWRELEEPSSRVRGGERQDTVKYSVLFVNDRGTSRVLEWSTR